MEGVLSFEYATEQFASVGGMDNLKGAPPVHVSGDGSQSVRGCVDMDPTHSLTSDALIRPI